MILFHAPEPPAVVARIARYRVLRDGQSAGTARIEQAVSATGKTVRTRMEILGVGGTTVLVTESNYDAKGAPTRKSLTRAVLGKAPNLIHIAEFGREEVQVTTVESGPRKVRQVAYPASAPRENPAENWFCRTRPNPGDAVTALVFSFDRMDWQGNETTYRGEEKVGERTVFSITVRQGARLTEIQVDTFGLPVTMRDAGGLSLEREP